MKKILALVIALTYYCFAFAQSPLRIQVTDARTNQPLPGATVALQGANIGAIADAAGMVLIANVPNGSQIIKTTFIGYEAKLDTLTFPRTDQAVLIIKLNPAEEGDELEEVTVSATRTSRTISNTPTRVEVISGEELEEKGNMKPGDIRMLLAESTGIQTQQTSATSNNSSIRIQGLDGKYTQIIRDGFPLYSGFSGGLGLLQIAPLDLKQVEVIKGSSSTLYGGGAIAGLVNLVSKTPGQQRQLNFLLNGTSAKGLDASMFYSGRSKSVGATIYAAYNHGSPYDPAEIDLTAIPKFNRYTLNPKLFLYLDDNTTLITGVNATVEDRIGGDYHYIKGECDALHSYFERNKTGRYSSQVDLKRTFHHGSFNVKNSVSYFDRAITLPGYKFSGTQVSSFSEASVNHSSEKTDLVAGINYVTEHFGEDNNSDFPLRSYSYNTIGAFVQATWNATERFTIETGLRADHHNRYGSFLLPRISLLYKAGEHWSSRLGGGLGYKAPTVFTEDAERIQFRNVLPVDVANTTAERSYGANYDINYRTGLFDDKVSFSINQMFFYTRINKPLLLVPVANTLLQYQQPPGDLNTKGLETNLKLTYGDFKLFIGYTYADVSQHTGNVIQAYPLVSRHRLNNVLMYEVEGKWKIGAEAYYFSRQQLNDGATGKAYWLIGLMAEKLWQRFSIFINFENLLDARQTRFDTIYTGSVSNPVFRDIYAPLDGFVVNGGIKFKL